MTALTGEEDMLEKIKKIIGWQPMSTKTRTKTET